MMRDTIQFALDLNIDWSEIKILTPLAGSEMYDIAKEKGYLIGDTSEHVYGRCSIKTPDFTPEQVKEIQYDANIRVNFLNNRNLKEKKFDIAEKVFSKLLSIYPNHLFAQWGVFKALEGQGKIEEASRALKRLAELAKQDKRNRLLLEKYNVNSL
jgi:tetratricopeptide (TPR) repeat protein